MDIFGIGPLEVLFILILVLIIFGPKDIAKTGKTIGKNLNKLVHSDTWKVINQTSQEIKNLPNRLMQESGLKDLEKTTRNGIAQAENMIRPPLEAGESKQPAESAAEASSHPADAKTKPDEPSEHGK